MKTLRKIRKNTKALSPVVASIILIAVTVAVSIAVAAWMGALTIGFMGTEEIRVTNADFEPTALSYADVFVKNTGTAAVTIEEIYVNGDLQETWTDVGSIEANTEATIRVTMQFQDGYSYQFKLVSSKGNPFVYTATAPVA